MDRCYGQHTQGADDAPLGEWLSAGVLQIGLRTINGLRLAMAFHMAALSLAFVRTFESQDDVGAWLEYTCVK